MTLHVEVVSPERILWTGEADRVIARTLGGGEIAFLTGHAPFVGALDIGTVRVHSEDGNEETIAVHGGFVEVSHDRVTVLSDVAEVASQIDVDRARAAAERAEASLRVRARRRGRGRAAAGPGPHRGGDGLRRRLALVAGPRQTSSLRRWPDSGSASSCWCPTRSRHRSTASAGRWVTARWAGSSRTSRSCPP